MPGTERHDLFADGKEPDALRTIGEVEAALGIKAHVLRYWEEQIPALKPLKRAGGRRLYRPGDVALLMRIDRMVNREGYTLRGVKDALRKREEATSEPDREGAAAPAVKAGAGRDLLPRLHSIRETLRQAIEAPAS